MMRFESLADMPVGMRKEAGRKIMQELRTKPQAVDQNGHVLMDGIWFDTKAVADRYVELMKARDLGLIKSLHIRQNVTISDTFVLPGGEKRRQLRFQADFSYIPVGGYSEGHGKDCEFWEEAAFTCPGMRVFEIMHNILPEARAGANARGIILREVNQ